MMSSKRWLGLAALLVAFLVLVWTVPVHSQRPQPGPQGQPAKGDEPLTTQLAKKAKLTEQQAQAFYNALGPILRSELSKGKTVELPGLGTFRVVRIAEHRDMAAGGRPVVVPARNTVEFLGGGELIDAANSASATPAEVVPPFQYIVVPGQVPSQKTGPVRNPGVRAP
jgi:nucleoid DNA-binding protein